MRDFRTKKNYLYKLQDAIALFHELEPSAGARLVPVSVRGRLAVPYHFH